MKCDISEALTEGESEWCGGGVTGEALDVVVLWYRLAMDAVTADERMLSCKWCAATIGQRGINALIVAVNRWIS